MKLARKLAMALFLGVFAVVAFHAYVRVRRDVRLFEEDIRYDAHAYGRALAAAVAEVSRVYGEKRARELVEIANQRERDVRIRWVAVDGPPGGPDSPAVSAHELSPVMRGEEVVTKIPYLEDEPVEHLVTYVPVRVDGHSQGAIELAESLSGAKQRVRATVVNTAIATLGVAVICGIVATGLGVWFVGRPMRSLVEQARRVGAGDLSTRIVLEQRDEIGELAAEMNLMCDKLEAANARISSEMSARITALDQLRHADRLATVGKLGAGVAHELGAPLQVISGRARLLVDGDASPDEVERNARIIIEQADRITRIVRQLLDFARRREARKSRVDLRGVVRHPLALLGPFAHKRAVTLAFEASEEPVDTEVDAEQIQQAITNLVVNGVQAMEQGGRLRVSVRSERVVPPSDIGGAEARFACVEVEDEGAGMPPEIAAHVFEPFFTTKDVGEGTGLGLSVSYGIVREHGGFIAVESDVGKGSRFRIFLPWSESTT